MSDAFDQKLRATDYYRHSVHTVGFSLSAHSSPRSLKAGLTIAYDGQYPLTFRSLAVWPDGANFEADVRAGMLAVLLKHGSPVIGGEFRLLSVECDAVESNRLSFTLAGREATRSLLNILQLDEKMA